MKKLALVIISTLIIVACSVDASEQTHYTEETTKLTIDDKTINLKVASTPENRAMGLMNVLEMPDNEGMLFVFETEEPRSFWMKNTEMPLDIIYLDKNKTITNIHYNTPTCKEKDPTQQKCPLYLSSRPAQYAIELNAGQAELHNLQPNQELDF